MTQDDARQQFLQILRELPYGNSVFFDVSKIDGPNVHMPPEIILGINKCGVHFFVRLTKEHLYSAELEAIKCHRITSDAVHFTWWILWGIQVSNEAGKRYQCRL